MHSIEQVNVRDNPTSKGIVIRAKVNSCRRWRLHKGKLIPITDKNSRTIADILRSMKA